MANDLILWQGGLFLDIKAKGETVITIEFVNFSQCCSLLSNWSKIFQYISERFFFSLFKPRFCVRSNADLMYFHYWGVSVWWILPSEQVKRIRNEVMCVLVHINGQIGMFFEIALVSINFLNLSLNPLLIFFNFL